MYRIRGNVAVLVVAFLAIVAAIISTVILLQRGLGAQDRGQLSQAVSSTFALFTGIIAIMLALRVETSDYQAEQRVKADIAHLLAAIRSMLLKCALAMGTGQAGKELELQDECSRVNDFLLSTSAFAMWPWVGNMSDEAGRRPTEWRTFFLSLAELLHMKKHASGALLEKCVKIERMVATLHAKDIVEISRIVSDLASSVEKFDASRNSDPLLKAVFAFVDEHRIPSDDFRAKILYLKESGVKDPDIDLWLAVTGPDGDEAAALTKAALQQGADLGTTQGDLLAKYAEQLEHRPN